MYGLEVCGFPEPENFAEGVLSAGNLLIFLDGVDEVLADNFNRFVQAIKVFSDRFDAIVLWPPVESWSTMSTALGAGWLRSQISVTSKSFNLYIIGSQQIPTCI